MVYSENFINNSLENDIIILIEIDGINDLEIGNYILQMTS